MSDQYVVEYLTLQCLVDSVLLAAEFNTRSRQALQNVVLGATAAAAY